MALILSDRVKVNTTTTGTGTVVLAATAPAGYQTFAVIADNNTTYYTIAGQTSDEWEVGIGTYYAANSSLSRDTVLSSSAANAAVTFSAGTKDVFVTYPSEKSVYEDASNVVTITSLVSSNVLISGGQVNSVAHTGGSINNMTIGATTANSGAFTTLTASANITLGNSTIQNSVGNLVFTTGGANVTAFSIDPNQVSSFFSSIEEKATISATAAGANVNLDAITQSILYYTSNATANTTINIRGSATVPLNNILANGQSISVVFMNTQGATAYYVNGYQIDGVAVTPKWQGGTAPTSGNTLSVDTYSFTAIKTANATYTVLASQTQFK